jgi:cation diffusion facilitator family transporter
MGVPFLHNGKATTIVSGFVNGFLALSKIVVGLFTNSSALFADGIHSLTDLLSDFFTYIMLRISQEDADESHPYGHGKFDTFGAFFIAAILFFSGVGIMTHAIHKYLDGHATLSMGGLAVIFAGLSIAANEGLYFYCKKVGKNINSPIVIANAWHHRMDSLSSIIALVGIVGAILGFPLLDVIAAVIIAIILCKASWDIGAKAFNDLVDGAVDRATIKKMGQLIIQEDGVVSLHHLRARTLGADIFVDVHVEVDPYISVSEGHAISENVEHSLKNNIKHVEDVTVHIDPYNEESGPYPEHFSRKELEKMVKKAIKNAAPKAKVKQVLFHVLREELGVEITFQKNTTITKTHAEKVKTLLKKEGFVHVQFSISL